MAAHRNITTLRSKDILITRIICLAWVVGVAYQQGGTPGAHPRGLQLHRGSTGFFQHYFTHSLGPNTHCLFFWPNFLIWFSKMSASAVDFLLCRDISVVSSGKLASFQFECFIKENYK